MKRLTDQELKAINEINGTMNDRYEYFRKIADMFNGTITSVKWDFKYVSAVAVDKTTIMDIRCKTVNGKKMISYLSINDFETREHEAYKLIKGNLEKQF